jgi:periplasmic protein TonB
VSASPGILETNRPFCRVAVALVLSLIVNVAIFAVAPVLLDQRVIPDFSRHTLLNLMMPLRPKMLEPEIDEPELLEELPQLELVPMESEIPAELPDPPELAPPELEIPEMEVPPLSPPTPEVPTPEIDVKSLSASSVPLAVNVPRTIAKAPVMQQTAPKMAENREYSMGEVDSKPGALGQALPPYPRRARRRGTEGWVKVRFLVTKDGRVRNLTILQESPTGVFHKTVMKTVPRWRFKPARKDGQSVDVWVKQTINFRLEK